VQLVLQSVEGRDHYYPFLKYKLKTKYYFINSEKMPFNKSIKLRELPLQTIKISNDASDNYDY
jgi:hypothetical protein